MVRCFPSIIDPAAMRLLHVRLPVCERRTYGRWARKAKLCVQSFRPIGQEFPALGADDEAAAPRAFRKTCLAQAKLCPGNTILKQPPFTAWEKLISLALAESEPVCDGILGQRRACLSSRRNFRKGKQQGLLIRYSCHGQKASGFFGLTRMSKDAANDVLSAQDRASRQ